MNKPLLLALLPFVLGHTAAALAAEPVSLQDALAQTYRTNPSLQAQRAKLRATDEQVAIAKSGWRPSIEGTAGVGKSDQVLASGGAFTGSGTLTPRDAGLTVTQPVFQGFRTVASVDAATAQVSAAEAAFEGFEQNLLLAAANTYLDVVETRTVLDLTTHNEEVMTQQLDATRARFNSGEVTKTDISQAEARLSVAKALRIQAQGGLTIAQAAYTRLIGEAPATLAQPDLSLDEVKTEEDVLALAAKANPAIVAATFAEDSAKANVTATKGSLLPEVNLVASATRGWDQSLMIPNRQDASTIMARVTIPLYRSGADYARTRAAQETAVASRLELEDARAQTKQAAITAWQSLATARAAIKAHEAAVEAMQLALQGVRVEAEVGQRTTLDILDAEQELLGAKVNLVKARHDEALAILQVKAAAGLLTARALRLPVDLADEKARAAAIGKQWIGF